MTEIIMRRVIQRNSNCIDIGCHKGEILDIMLELAPEGKHSGFEPIPAFFHQLEEKYTGKATIFPYALSDKEGTADFQYVRNAPAYSGLRKRDYQINPDIEVIQVKLKTLDDLLRDQVVHFIKIDVEGAEFDVLKGALDIIRKNKPYIIFEFGVGASNYYDSTPEKMFSLLVDEGGLNISLLKSFTHGGQPMTAEEFKKVYEAQKEYYFIAHP